MKVIYAGCANTNRACHGGGYSVFKNGHNTRSSTYTPIGCPHYECLKRSSPAYRKSRTDCGGCTSSSGGILPCAVQPESRKRRCNYRTNPFDRVTICDKTTNNYAGNRTIGECVSSWSLAPVAINVE